MLTKMKRLVTSQRGVQELEEFQFGGEGRKVPLFHGWTTKQFGERCPSTPLLRSALGSNAPLMCFRGLIPRPPGRLRPGARAEAGDSAGTRPHGGLRPLRGLPVLLAPPAVRPPPGQTDA